MKSLFFVKPYKDANIGFSKCLIICICMRWKSKPGSVNYLGVKHSILAAVSANCIKAGPEKLSVIANWPRPHDLKEVRSVLRFASYNCDFIYGFLWLAEPVRISSSKRIKADQENLPAITNWSIPEDMKEVRSFLVFTYTCTYAVQSIYFNRYLYY